MPFIDIDSGNATHYVFMPPQDGKPTFVFCNSMGMSTKFWSSNIAPGLAERGFGTLIFDYRGQGESRYDDTATLESAEIISDIVRVVNTVAPPRPILVGIAIGGIYAAAAINRGARAAGLVMSNSLRLPGPHTEWLIELESRLLEMGGLRLANDALSPPITSSERLAEMRPTHLLDMPYEPWPKTHPRVRIQHGLKTFDWDVRYEELDLPVLVLTGKHNRRSIKADVDAILARIPNVRSIVFPNAGLVLHKEIPGEMADCLADFAAAI